MEGRGSRTPISNTVAASQDGRRAGVSSHARAQEFSLYAPNGGRKYLNRDERQRVLAAMAELPTDQALFALTLAWTGGRSSEVLGLTPSSFQIERGIVAIRTLKRRRHHVRELPLPPELMAALERHFKISAKQRAAAKADQRLWHFCRQTAWRSVRKVMNRCGITGRQASPRGLRHAFGVGTLQSGVPLSLVQRWLGHARMSTTAIYADVSGPEEVEFAARFWGAQKAKCHMS
jgi:integrase/recombinase XerD